MSTQILHKPIYTGLMVSPMKPVLGLADLPIKLGREVLWNDLADGSAMVGMVDRARPRRR
jgi:hypothetical protein